MKFTDGHWMMRKGITPTYAVEVLDVATTTEGMRILAPTYPVRNRRDLQSGAVLTLDVTTPLPDVIGVRITHHAGTATKAPQFELFPVNTTPTVDGTTLTSGALSVRLNRGEPWRIDFLAGGRTLTTGDAKDTAIMSTQDGGHHLVQRLGLNVGDAVYGMGERFGPLAKNGQAVDIWMADGGTCTEQAYKNVPFFLTNAGYGVFVNHPGLVSFEVGSEDVSKVQFSIESQSMQYFVIYGPTPKEILSKYTALTGRPALPPAWSFGLWLSTSFNTDYDEETVTSFIEGMAERDLPLSVFHFDCFWMRELSWCDFEWDPKVFPDPRGMLARLKERGLKVCVWINPYIAQRSNLFEEGKARGYFLKRPNGDVWQWDLWQPGQAIVDFTNPEAREWYASKLDVLLDMGVDCFKSDFGERIPTDAVYYDGSDPAEMHNYYTYLYNKTVFDLLRKRRGEGDAVVFARSATVGTQQFPVHWGGDNLSTPQSMAESLRGGLSLTMSGFGFWSHDIGGFEGTPEAWLFKRWIAFGLLSSHSRLHANYSYRVPWAFDEEAVDVLRAFTKLKATLMPYLYQAARVAHLEGIPVMRAMVVEFPDDPACTHLDRQYLLGPDLLVAPVFTEDGRVDYYVPDGEWTHYLTGETITGPRWVREEHGFSSVPLLVRPGAVLPVGAVDDRPDYDYADGVTLRVFGLADGATATTEVPTVAGDVACTFTTTRRGDTVHVTVDNPPARWQVQVGSSSPVSTNSSSITVDLGHS